MVPLEADLLSLWESGAAAPPIVRALLLAGFAAPGEDASDRPVGERNALLLRLRNALYGDALPVEVGCPACRVRVEFSLSAGTLLTPSHDEVGPALEWGGSVVHVRAPTTRDLLGARNASDLLRACAPEASDELLADPGFAIYVGERAARLDPLSHIEIDVACTACGHSWADHLDPGVYLWHEVSHTAEGLMLAVGRLAARFGWTEPDVLALGAARRAFYLRMVDA